MIQREEKPIKITKSKRSILVDLLESYIPESIDFSHEPIWKLLESKELLKELEKMKF